MVHGALVFHETRSNGSPAAPAQLFWAPLTSVEKLHCRVMLPPPAGAARRRPPPTSCSVAAGDLRAMGRRWKTRRRAVATMVKRARPEGSPRHGHGSSHSRAV